MIAAYGFVCTAIVYSWTNGRRHFFVLKHYMHLFGKWSFLYHETCLQLNRRSQVFCERLPFWKQSQWLLIFANVCQYVCQYLSHLGIFYNNWYHDTSKCLCVTYIAAFPVYWVGFRPIWSSWSQLYVFDVYVAVFFYFSDVSGNMCVGYWHFDT